MSSERVEVSHRCSLVPRLSVFISDDRQSLLVLPSVVAALQLANVSLLMEDCDNCTSILRNIYFTTQIVPAKRMQSIARRTPRAKYNIFDRMQTKNMQVC
jgi:hypothetical protein